MKVVSVMEVQARTDLGHEPPATGVPSRIEKARVVDLVLLVAANHDPSVAHLESGHVDGIGESMLTEIGPDDAVDPATVVGVR